MGAENEEERKNEVEEPQEAVEARMAKVKHKIMVMSGKGGVYEQFSKTLIFRYTA
ncbi:MAG: hypothetical protein QMD80_01945 [archaeon]|nr:hypothetical protein [archaeon]